MYDRIAVLGGSYLQSDFIKTATDRGLVLFVLDGNSNCHVSDWPEVNFIHLNFSDADKVLSFCKEKEIDLVYAPSNEIGNLICSKVSAEVGFNYNPQSVVEITLNKVLQREIVKKCKSIYSPKSIHFAGSLEALELDIGYPMVIKPSTSSASRGVSGVRNRKELTKAIEEAKQFLSRNGEILAEEFVLGDQISIETVSVNGKHHIVGITQEVVSPAPFFLERCHYMNAEVHEKFYSLVEKPVYELMKAVGIEYGPCHIELKVSDEKVVLIEIASRAGGWRDVLMKKAGYPDFNQLILDCYLEGKVNEDKIQPPSRHGLVNILMKPEDLNSVTFGKRDGCLKELYLNNKGPEFNPRNLIDAYGYAYFSSTESLNLYALEQSL